MSQIIVMPKLGFNQDEGVLVTWYKKEGEAVKKGTPLFAIETDKTVMDMDATCDGVVRKLLCEEGETVPVTVPIAIVADKDEDISALLAQVSASPQQENKQEAALPRQENQTEPAPIQRLTGESVYKALQQDAAYKALQQNAAQAPHQEVVAFAPSTLKISPRARRLAMEMGLDLDRLMGDIIGTGYEGGVSEEDVRNYLKTHKATPVAKAAAAAAGLDTRDIEGSGISGRVTKSDVQSAFEKRDRAHVPAGDKEVLEEVPYSGVRKIIGERLAQSKVCAPHIYFTQKIDMQNLLELRKAINEAQDCKTSVTDYVARAAVIALQKYPDVNASLSDNKILKYASVNIGIAVAAPGGLIVPVVHEAQRLSLRQLAAKTAALFAKAREGKLMPDEYSNGTFTISNLGMFGVDNFSAVINPPESAILAVSATKDEAAVIVDCEGNKSIGIRPMMNIQLSADHRVIDGMMAAQFVTEIKRLLENPFGILI